MDKSIKQTEKESFLNLPCCVKIIRIDPRSNWHSTRKYLEGKTVVLFKVEDRHKDGDIGGHFYIMTDISVFITKVRVEMVDEEEEQ